MPAVDEHSTPDTQQAYLCLYREKTNARRAAIGEEECTNNAAVVEHNEVASSKPEPYSSRV